MSIDKFNAKHYPDPTAYAALKNAKNPKNPTRVKNPKRVAQGRQAKASGAAFESYIDLSLMHYKKNGIADVQKTPEPMKPLKPVPGQPGKFIAVFVKQAQADYKGILMGGKSVMFEAKHTIKERIAYGQLTPEQIDNLRSYDKFGAVCFILVSFNFKNFYRIPWIAWRDMKEIYGRKYLLESDIQEYKVKFENGIINFLYKSNKKELN